MSILTDAQKSALIGRLLGVGPATSVDAIAPERVAPTGTVVGTEPSLMAGNGRLLLIGGAVLAVTLVLVLARKR